MTGEPAVDRGSDDVIRLGRNDHEEIRSVINDAARAYDGVIPAESYSDPYMSATELTDELADIEMYGVDRDDRLVGVMGLQTVEDVTLIRHLYVRSEYQRQGIGSKLLATGIERTTTESLLVGTWKAADWAVDFYEAHGFESLGTDRSRLDRYWDVPEPHASASVVLRYTGD